MASRLFRTIVVFGAALGGGAGVVSLMSGCDLYFGSDHKGHEPGWPIIDAGFPMIADGPWGIIDASVPHDARDAGPPLDANDAGMFHPQDGGA